MDNNNIENVEEVEVEVEAQDAPQARGTRPMMRRKKKVCAFCAEKIGHIDYKDTARLRKYITERAKILPRRVTGTCAHHQNELTKAIKRARFMALMPYLDD